MSKSRSKKEPVTDVKKMSFRERNRLSGGYLLKSTLRKYLVSICRFLLLFGMCFMILQPILNKISVSFMTESDLYNPIVIAIPEHFTTENYRLAAELMSYGQALVNSLVISFTIALLQVTVCLLVGYGFARFEFPLKRFWFACVILVILIPPQTIASSLHLHFRFFDFLGIVKLVHGGTLNLRGSVIPYYLMSANAEPARLCHSLLSDERGLHGVEERALYLYDPPVLPEYPGGSGGGGLCGWLRDAANLYPRHAAADEADRDVLLPVRVCLAVDGWILFQDVPGQYQAGQHGAGPSGRLAQRLYPENDGRADYGVGGVF